AVPEREETADVDAILAAVTDKTRVVFLANPNNPTGTYLAHQDVRRLHAALPGHVLLVLDAAYAEYLSRNDYESGIELAGTADNVIMTRTFSKIHGLANLRVGWGFGPATVIDALNRVRGPFNVSGPALAAATAAMRDRAHVERARLHNDEWLPWVVDQLTALGLRVTPSVANFVLVHFPSEEIAQAADQHLRANGVVVRSVGAYGFPAALRMSIGSEGANQTTIALIREVMGKAG
ncbi:MAG: histidinol-phosphate transaminase, partial [Pseudomonadota bacterium]